MKEKVFLVVLTIMTVFLPASMVSAISNTELYNNASNNVLFYVKSGGECDPNSVESYKSTVTGDQITWIGDSYSVGAKKLIEQKYPGTDIHAKVSKFFAKDNDDNPSGLTIAKELAESNKLRNYVVFLLGTNGGNHYDESKVAGDINELVTIAGSNRVIVLMTPYTKNGKYEAHNKAVRAAAEGNDKILVADWENEVKDKLDEYFTTSEDHPNTYEPLVKVVVDVLTEYTSKNSSAAPSTVGATLGSASDVGSSENNALKVGNWLSVAGYDGDAIAAILANLKAESGIVPNKLEGGKLIENESWRIKSWEKYGNKGFGIAQWTTSGRQDKLQTFADNSNLPIISLEAQGGYLLQELKSKGYKSRVEDINGKGLAQATYNVWRYFETPGASFWTTHEGKVYNNCAPTGLTTGSCPLSETNTKAAWNSFNTRLGYAKSFLALVEANGLGKGSGIVWTPGAGGSTGGICTTAAQGAQSIAQLARDMAWPNEDGKCQSVNGDTVDFKNNYSSPCASVPRAKNKEVIASLGKTASWAMDCAHFVYSVVKYLKIDDNFPGGSGGMWQYLQKDEAKSKWQIIPNLENTSNLMPGDIAVYPNAHQIGLSDNEKAYGHVQIYIGDLGGSYGKAAEASAEHWVARVGKMDFVHNNNGAVGAVGNKYLIARYIGDAVGDIGDTPGEEDPGGGGGNDDEPISDDNLCQGGMVAKGTSYQDQMVDLDHIKKIARVVKGLGCDSTNACKAVASYLVNRYEQTNKQKGIYDWIMSQYSSYNTGELPGEYSMSVSAVKYVFNSADGFRTLPGNAYEMTTAKQMKYIKLDASSKEIVGSEATNKQLSQLKKDVSVGQLAKKIYDGELTFYCATKDKSGNYNHLFWRYYKKRGNEELK